MAVEIKVPSVGESITEGTIARWLKKDGDAVRAGEPVFELETEKATSEVPAPAAGTLRITKPEGSTAAVGSVVGRLEDRAAPRAAAAKAKPSEPRPPDKAGAEEPAKKPEGAKKRPEAGAAQQGGEPSGVSRRFIEPVLSPEVRRLARDEGIDVHELAGSGRGGRITKEDVLKHVQQRGSGKEPPPEPKPAATTPPAPQASGATGERRQRMSAIRQRIAQRLVAAQHQAAILTTFNEADLSAVMALRSKYKETFQKKHGVGLGLMSFFVKASVEALRAFPVANAFLDGDEIVYHDEYHIGIAVSSERGLMVPVLRDADRLSFGEIEKGIAELAQKARDGKISVADLQGGTFTITNGGVFGSLLSTPLLNPPQSAILGMHTIQKRPVAHDEQIVIRPMMYLALSYDHRLIDGREAVGFLVRIRECIEDPDRLLLEL